MMTGRCYYIALRLVRMATNPHPPLPFFADTVLIFQLLYHHFAFAFS